MFCLLLSTLSARCPISHLLWCAGQVCRAAAGDAATYAERASTSAGVASEAVTRARRAIGDAEVSAEAEAAARKAGVL